MRLAGRDPVGIISELIGSDGEMPRDRAVIAFAAEHDLPVLAIADLVRYRRATERLVERVASSGCCLRCLPSAPSLPVAAEPAAAVPSAKRYVRNLQESDCGGALRACVRHARVSPSGRRPSSDHRFAPARSSDSSSHRAM
ncbi:3,4-dihydroxy-2-butanone-4-phosphate synthase [Pseudonocardia kujensis]|uniref:3,4-dihydroxy-2-butanone-4-phosphate synthase n=1 Tax=Pseudonocardia kujensis TaxID=1128675 RepID=UPI001E461AF1|nr:3,4-dihydroxy-2-butanone-4-phosphate synthase [Pseudonocardia kujensis]MCE0767011.1 3,4-dihydroxy-2-butanone-4-phosphate synthase [Pseudonocardia kujensis]